MTENPVVPADIAVVWDFGKTLTPNPLEPLLKRFSVDGAEFWEQVSRQRSANSYLDYVVECVNEGLFKRLSNYQLRELGSEIRFYEGLPDFLDKVTTNTTRITDGQILVSHYLVSADIKEMIEGSRIRPYTKGVWGCEFTESLNATCEVVVNGIRSSIDVQSKVLADLQRHIGEFRGLVFVGGARTVPAVFNIVRERYGGGALAVYDPLEPSTAHRLENLRARHLVDEIGIANYTEC